jgi:hypothetical protein
LRFAEFVATQPAQRVMRISLEDVEVESHFDVYALAGVAQALDRVYTTTVADGQVKVLFEATDDSGLNPMVAAVAVKLIAPLSTATPTPTVTPTAQPPTATPTSTPQPAAYTQRANAGGATYTDGQGQVWAADKSYALGSWGYTGGSSKSSTAAVAGTSDDLLYQKYREGLSRYDFTVPNGVYQITIKFAEFAASKNGERRMQIIIEGSVVENDLDVYATVGKAAALDRTYTTGVGDGLLTIAFAQNGGKYKPMVSAIEVRR